MQNTERQLITGVPGQNIYIQVRKVIKYVIVCLGILSLGFWALLLSLTCQRERRNVAFFSACAFCLALLSLKNLCGVKNHE